jgi:hypothetical protein
MTVGHHEAAWRFPESPLLGAWDIKHYAHLARSGLEAFVDHVVPVLRRRGLFRTEYTGRTLRDHYGLPRPLNQFSTRLESPVAASGA